MPAAPENNLNLLDHINHTLPVQQDAAKSQALLLKNARWLTAACLKLLSESGPCRGQICLNIVTRQKSAYILQQGRRLRQRPSASRTPIAMRLLPQTHHHQCCWTVSLLLAYCTDTAA